MSSTNTVGYEIEQIFKQLIELDIAEHENLGASINTENFKFSLSMAMSQSGPIPRFSVTQSGTPVLERIFEQETWVKGVSIILMSQIVSKAYNELNEVLEAAQKDVSEQFHKILE